MKKFKFEYDKDTDFIYLMDPDYEGDGLSRDLLYFEYTEYKNSLFKLYQLCRMTRPVNDGKLKVIGVDLV